ncbi:MAG TPA: amidohydrolase family protein [Gemmatimonadales bacterium]|nr:amidohydrolase family protein [Gemmatimonadales bacterium]
MTARWRAWLLGGCLLVLPACTSPGKGMIALEGATLIDGAGGPPKRDALILIRDGHIEDVARVNEIPVPRGAQRIQLIGKTIIPGLVDAHARVEPWAAPQYLAWGVTSVRDFGSGGDTGTTLKKDVNLGSILGPRVYTSGALIDGVPATQSGATAVATDEEARRAVDQRAVADADYVVIATKITPELLKGIMDEAATLHLPVAAELGKIDALAAARAGVATIEGLSGITQFAARNAQAIERAHDLFYAGWTAEEQAWATLDSASVARAAKALAATRVAMVPTLAVHELWSHLDDPTRLQRPEMADVPADSANPVRDVSTLLRRSGWKPQDFAAFRAARARENQFVREFRAAGGIVAAGSGAGNPLLPPGTALHEEMALLVAAGWSNVDAITAATRRGAEVLHTDSIGVIAPGKVADLVVLAANPADSITAVRHVAWVMTRGRIIRPDSLRATWKR